jgi:hypothetical protein
VDRANGRPMTGLRAIRDCDMDKAGYAGNYEITVTVHLPNQQYTDVQIERIEIAASQSIKCTVTVIPGCNCPWTIRKGLRESALKRIGCR